MTNEGLEDNGTRQGEIRKTGRWSKEDSIRAELTATKEIREKNLKLSLKTSDASD